MTQAVSHLACLSGTDLHDHQDSSDDSDSDEAERKLLLVVEDEPTLLEVICFVLESESYEVETARNGEEALARLRTGPRPALVLLDLMMPVMSGRELLDEVARSPSIDPPPIVVLTAGGPVDVPGAVEVLPKPYDLELLIESVERHTGHKGGRGVSTRAR